MKQDKYLDVSIAYLFCQLKKKEEEKQKLTHKDYILPFVTISREAGAGGTIISEMLVDYLTLKDKPGECPWALFDKNLIKQVNEDYKLNSFENRLPENKFSEIQSMFEELFGLHPSKRELAHKLSNSIKKLAKMGNAVIVGRGGAIITRNLSNGFHLRLIGSKMKRVKHMMETYSMSRKKAEEFVVKEDKLRADYVKKLFGLNVADPHLYDMVINTDNISYSDIIKIVAESIFRLKESVNK